jgi:hypothetical protein
MQKKFEWDSPKERDQLGNLGTLKRSQIKKSEGVDQTYLAHNTGSVQWRGSCEDGNITVG